MNYRHAYHAGNFADAFKHIVLVALIKAMSRKDKPFCFLDTHAGIGIYDLMATAAKKSGEADSGITKIYNAPNPPALIQDYLACVAQFNELTPDQLRYYPGSPGFARRLLRPQDKMVLTELHEDDWQSLKKNFPHYKQVAIHHQDGYQALKAFLPPKERRGLTLIDPPYEKPNELTTVVTALAEAVTRFATGVFALWYPIKDSRSLTKLHHAFQNKLPYPLLITELCIYPETLGTELNGCGMLIVNPPWQLHETIQEILPWLWNVLSPNKQGRYNIISH
jgi:23S rRNA (adenine2030-N6)-methyltransferase